MKHIVITNYSDPVCVWCWSTEPIFRAMETHYPNRFSIRYVMGGMVRDLSDFDDEENGIGGGDADTINAQLREHLAESTAVHHMPVAVDKYHLFSERFNSSFPQNIAYKAAQIAAPDMADSFLRRIREATLTEGAVTGDYEVLDKLAEEFGLPMDAYREALKSGEAEKAFKSDVDEAIAAKVQVFPTVTLTVNGKEETFGGYYTFDDYVARIRKLSDGAIEPAKPDVSFEYLSRLLKQYHRLAAEEIRCAFDFETKEALDSWLAPYLADGKVAKEQLGGDYMITLASV